MGSRSLAFFVYVIFEDGTGLYWARSRVLEFLNSGLPAPGGRRANHGTRCDWRRLGKEYAVISKELNLSDTRAIQDWNLKFALAKAEGVAEVASVGGFVRQYNVILDPQRMRDLGITMQNMRDAMHADLTSGAAPSNSPNLNTSFAAGGI